MKATKILKILLLMLPFLFMHYPVIASNGDEVIDNAEVVSLYKDQTYPKVLAGIANVRFKSSAYKNTIHSTNNSFKILNSYLLHSQKVSNQIARFTNYSTSQQKRILELEEQLSRTFVVSFDTREDILHFCKRIVEQNSNIEVAEPYYVQQLQAMPNDPMLQQQSVLFNINAFDAWYLTDNTAFQCDTILIGVSDSGVNWYHEDLKDCIAFNEGEIPFNGIDDDNNGYIDDYNGYNFAYLEDGGIDYCGDVYNTGSLHGTYVCGIIAARINNGKGIAGVANRCKIVPIKIKEKGNDGYLYSYPSLIYAANRGCKVLNCSWGSVSPFSIVEQSIVDYAIACDVAIVAAGGNISGGVNDTRCLYYPSGYYGVLGVGQTDANDNVHLGRSSLGTGCRIMAQGEGNISVEGSDKYTTLTWGSSYASPVVAGVVAVLRSYKPELDPIQAVEIVRTSAESIRNKANNGNNQFIPNRVNMLNALLYDNTTLPCIILREQYYENTSAKKTERFFPNDTAVVSLNLINVLSDAQSITININPIFALDEHSFELLDSTAAIPSLAYGDVYPLKLRLLIHNPTNIHRNFFLANITADNYTDEIKFEINLSDQLTTFENKKLLVAATDNGIIGRQSISNNLILGGGFSHKTLGDFLYKGGIIAVAEYSKAVSSIFDTEVADKNSFSSIKGLYGDSSNKCIITDNKASVNNRIGIELTTRYVFPSDSSSAMRIQLTAKNVSGNVIHDLSIGHFYDWDINNSRYNWSGYLPEAIPASIGSNYAAAEYMTDAVESVFVGSLVFTDSIPDKYVIPQASALPAMASRQDQIRAMTSGISIQPHGLGLYDAFYTVGMHFTDNLMPNSEVTCTICTGFGVTKEELAKVLRNCANSLTTIQHSDNVDFSLHLNAHQLSIETDLLDANVEIYNANGMLMTSFLRNNVIATDTQNYPIGAYFVRVYTSKISLVKGIIIK